MRILFFSLTVAVLGMACQEEDAPPVQSPVKHVLLQEAAPFHYLKAYSIDFNQDSLLDIQFTVSLDYSEGAEHTRFIANSLRDGKIMLLESTAIAYSADMVIGPEVASGDTVWGIQSGELLIKSLYESAEVLWSGSWESNPEAYLAVSFKIDGEDHYGWVKLQADTEYQQIFVQEYAYHTTSGLAIKTGQRE